MNDVGDVVNITSAVGDFVWCNMDKDAIHCCLAQGSFDPLLCPCCASPTLQSYLYSL